MGPLARVFDPVLLELVPNLRLTPELDNPKHVFVRADTMELHLEWSAARERPVQMRIG